MKAIVSSCGKPLQMSALVLCLQVIILMGAPLIVTANETEVSDQRHIQEIEALLASDSELESSFITYEDSLNAHPEMADQEEALAEALAEDPELQERLAEFEDELAADPGSAERMVSYDSLMAANPELAGYVEEMERLAAEDPDLLESHGEAMASLEDNPDEADDLLANEEGPAYAGGDPAISAYVVYLKTHPTYYKACWRVYHYARTHPSASRVLRAHWRWFHPRKNLREAWWRYRIQSARNLKAHRIIWKRRAYLGHRPALAHHHYRHRVVVSSRPAMKKHIKFIKHNPRLTRQLIQHRKHVYNKTHKLKPAHKPKKAPKSPKTKAQPKKPKKPVNKR